MRPNPSANLLRSRTLSGREIDMKSQVGTTPKLCGCFCGCTAKVFFGEDKCNGCARGFHDDGKTPPGVPKVEK